MIEFSKDNFTLSTDRSRLDLQAIHQFLSTQAYWALGRSFETVQLSIENSVCFGLYESSRQVGFCRVITDTVTFAWLCDVFIISEYRKLGLGKWMMECVINSPELKKVRRFLLATRDAHGLYQEYAGFAPLRNPERWMERINPELPENDVFRRK
jgi:hypothetical protein